MLCLKRVFKTVLDEKIFYTLRIKMQDEIKHILHWEMSVNALDYENILEYI